MPLLQKQVEINFQNSNKVIVEIFNIYTKLKQIQNNNKESTAAQTLFIETIKFSKKGKKACKRSTSLRKCRKV